VRTTPSLAPFVLLVVTLALGPAGAALLYAFAHLGQRPPDALPTAVVVLLGALLATPAAFMRRRLDAARRRAAIALGTLAAVATALALGALVGDATATATTGLVPAGAAGAALAGLASTAFALVLSSGLLALRGERTDLVGGASVFVVCTVLANFTLDSFVPLGDFFLVNVGTLFFGITFTQRDRLHRFGRPLVYRLIAIAAVANVLAALALGTPLRYVAVSFLAIVVAETANTEVYHRLLRFRWLARVAGSNAVAAPIDTILFTTLAFAGAPFATLQWMTQVIVTDVIVKYAASMVAAITILSRPEWIPRAPGEADPRPGPS
jgi:queuosine precursor transporter